LDSIDGNSRKLLIRASGPLAASRSGDVRIGPLLVIPELLAEHGIDPPRAFALAGVDSGLFQNPENRMPYEAAARLLEVCANLTGCRHFGLLLGERFNLGKFGPIGALMRHSPNVGDSLQVLLRSLHLHDRGATPILITPDPSSAMLGYSVLRHGAPGAELVYDLAITIGYRILRELCGAAFAPIRVLFSYSRPRLVAPYSRLFRSSVDFDADFSCVVFDASWLAHPNETADAEIRETLARAVLKAQAEGPMSFAERVESALHQRVLSGDVFADSVASLFGIGERTLRRQLSEEGASLQQLVNRTRHELARQLLSNTAMPVSSIAAALHYADPNAFSRAFRKWAGLSPIQWRKRDRDGDTKD